MWRGGRRFGLSVAASFVWRCPSTLALTPFPHPAHRTGLADRPHPALGQNITPSPTTGHAQVALGVRVRCTNLHPLENAAFTRRTPGAAGRERPLPGGPIGFVPCSG